MTQTYVAKTGRIAKVGSLKLLGEKPMSPARARLVDAAQTMRFGLKQLSVMVDKNPSYLQQYIVRASPRALPEDTRLLLAQLLNVPEHELRDGGLAAAQGTATAPTGVTVAEVRRAAQAATDKVRLMADTHLQLDAEATDQISPNAILADATQDAVMIRLTRSHGLLQARTLCLVRPGDDVKAGDVVAVITEHALQAIGVMVPAPRGKISVMDGAETLTFDAASAAAWRILAIRCS
jgi:hypothetical protein